MIRFYWERLWEAPGLLFLSILSVEGFIMAAGFALVLMNKEIGRKILHWDGISRWWALVPIGVWFFLAVLHANYQAFVTQGSDSAAVIKGIRDEVGDLKTSLKVYEIETKKLAIQNAELMRGAPILAEEVFRIKEIRDALLKHADAAPLGDKYSEKAAGEWIRTTASLCNWIKVKGDDPNDPRPQPISWFESIAGDDYLSFVESVASFRASALNLTSKDLPD